MHFIFTMFETKLPLQVPETDEVDCLPGGDVEAARPSLEAGAKLGEDTQAEAAASLVPNGGTRPVPEQPRPRPEVISEDNPVKVERLQQAESLQRQPSRSSIASIKSRIMVRNKNTLCMHFYYVCVSDHWICIYYVSIIYVSTYKHSEMSKRSISN